MALSYLSSGSRESIVAEPAFFAAGTISLEFGRIWLDRRAVGASPSGRFRASVIAAVLTSCALARTGLATGSVTVIRIHCSALTDAQRDELDARAQLLILGASQVEARRVEFSCDDTPGVVLVDTPRGVSRAPIEPGPEPVERALRALENLLARVERAASETPKPPTSAVTAPEEREEPTPSEGSDGEVPVFDAATPPRSVRARTIGGAGLGVAVEPWPAPASTGVGPRLDLGWGLGSWSAISFESLRLGSTPQHQLVAFDALVGAAWGGPFAPRPFGAAFAIGGEWFSATASEQPTSKRSRSSFVVDLGLRLAQPVGAGTVWLAADGRFRIRELDLPDPVTASLNRWSVIFSAGGALTVR